MTHPSSCPIHAPDATDSLSAWSCPDDCHHFLVELDRRIEDINHGNFIKTWRDSDGAFHRQEYSNHEPVGEPVLWELMNRARADHGEPDLDELGTDSPHPHSR